MRVTRAPRGDELGGQGAEDPQARRIDHLAGDDLETSPAASSKDGRRSGAEAGGSGVAAAGAGNGLEFAQVEGKNGGVCGHTGGVHAVPASGWNCATRSI